MRSVFGRELTRALRSPWFWAVLVGYPLSGLVASSPLRAVLLLTPPLLAGSLAGLRNRATLDVLLATPMPRTELVLGAFLARLLPGALAVGLLLAVRPADAVAVLGTFFGLAGVSLIASALCPGPRTTVVLAVGLSVLVLQFLAAFSPTNYSVWSAIVGTVRFPREVPQLPPVADRLVFLAVNLILVLGGVAVSAWAIRHRGRAAWLDVPAVVVRTSPFRPAVSDDAFGWREWFARRPRPMLEGVLGLLVGQALVAAVVAQMLWLFPARYRPASWWTAPTTAAAVLVVCLIWAGLPAALSLTRERARGVLPLLLLAPDGARRLLAARWRVRSLAPWPLLVPLAGMLIDHPWNGASWVGVAATVVITAAAVPFAVALGLCLSARFPSSLWAGVAWSAGAGVAFSPLAALWRPLLAADPAPGVASLTGGLLLAVAYALGGRFLWGDAVRTQEWRPPLHRGSEGAPSGPRDATRSRVSPAR